uniref:Arginine/serine-rich protein PNISR n=1 Tax=Musca domestica TaxID=7370 RepID=A0A1I8N920_MUSDO
MNGPYQFINQAAVTSAMASGQNIDWASLAQQWIKMRDSALISGNETNAFSTPTTRYEEEKGEADMDMDEDDQIEKTSAPKYISDSIMQQSVETGSTAPWYMDKTNRTDTVGTDPETASQNQWDKWNKQHTSKQAHQNIQNRRQVNQTVHIPSLLKMNVPHPNEIRCLSDPSSDSSNASNIMDAAKRKGLPAWIREGLEKMEREKQKQQGKYQITENEKFPTGGTAFAKPTSSKESETNELKEMGNEYDEQDDTVPSSDVIEKDLNEDLLKEDIDESEVSPERYEQRLEKMMIVVRQTLTELLLEVTNEEISKLANETLKNYKLKASSAQVVHNSALSDITGKLGLAVYGHSSSDDSSDDEDNVSTLKNGISSGGNDSEEDIKASLRLKKRSFQKIATEIEERVSAAAFREAEKLKQCTQNDEANEISRKTFGVETNVCLENSKMVTNEPEPGSSSKIVGNIIDESGEATETKLQSINGKRHRDRGTIKERTTRFSDNRDNKYLTIATTSTCITEAQSTPTLCNITTSQVAANQGLALYNINTLVPKHNYPSIVANNMKNTTSTVTGGGRNKRNTDPDHESEHIDKYSKKKYYSDKKRTRSLSRSRSRSRSSSSSSTSATSSESSITDSSEDSSRSHSRRSHSGRSSSKKRIHRDQRSESYYSSYGKNRSSYSRRRYDTDSDDEDESYKNRRKASSRYYSTSHSSRNHRETTRPRSKSSYSSSRRH